jgi:hypothetical protein
MDTIWELEYQQVSLCLVIDLISGDLDHQSDRRNPMPPQCGTGKQEGSAGSGNSKEVRLDL